MLRRSIPVASHAGGSLYPAEQEAQSPTIQVGLWLLCGIRESNPCLNLGKVAFYH